MSAETDRDEIGALRAEIERLRAEIPRQRAAAVRDAVAHLPHRLPLKAQFYFKDYADRMEKQRWHQ